MLSDRNANVDDTLVGQVEDTLVRDVGTAIVENRVEEGQFGEESIICAGSWKYRCLPGATRVSAKICGLQR